MKRFLTIVSALCICATLASNANAQIRYGWTVSNSQTDPLSNGGLPNGGTDNLYLWFYCSSEGMAAAEMTLESTPPGQVLAFNVMNGYLNAGNATNLLLAVGGCPIAPVVAGAILILHFAPLAVCLTGANVTVDCSTDPSAWPHDIRGYADAGLPLCLNDSIFPCHTDSVEESSWGSIKSLYR
jgi:hypothetical protein